MFRYEMHMQPIVSAWLSQRGFEVTTEFQTAQGVADLVACQWRPAMVRKRVSELGRFRFRSRLSAALWCEIGDETEKSSSIRRLTARYGALFGNAEVLREIEWLVARGLLGRDGQCVYREAPCFPVHRELIAIELKLSRVLDGIRQATRYRDFADHAYVALPADAAMEAQARVSERFETTGLGLLSVSPQQVRVLIRPERDPVVLNPLSQLLAVERFWRLAPRDS